MKDNTASHTARSVAAHRLDYERIKARALLARAGWRADDPEGPRRARLAATGLLVARAAADYPERIVSPPSPPPTIPNG